MNLIKLVIFENLNIIARLVEIIKKRHEAKSMLAHRMVRFDIKWKIEILKKVRSK